jgi:DMSO/TMAO reductase YedYZ molybdopterin-dependent catalytic subunit
MVASQRYRVLSGIGAGAGGALAMVAAMGLMRWLLGFPSIPEVMLNTFLTILGGRLFSDLLDRYYYSGLPLFVTLVLLGTLLLGALLGLLYAWLSRPNQTTGKRHPFLTNPLAGVVYGLLIGLLLNVLFLPLVGQEMFAGFSSQFSGMYSASSVPPWVGLMLLALIFGTVTHLLLMRSRKTVFTSETAPDLQSAIRNPQSEMVDADRRQVLRIAGGTVLALMGGAIFWYGGTVLRQGGFTSPVDVTAEEDAEAGTVPEEIDTPTPESVSQAPRPTATPEPRPTSTPETRPADTPPTATRDSQPPPTTAEPPTATTPPAQPTTTPTPQIAAQAPTATPKPAATSTPGSPLPVAIPINEITPTRSFYHVSKNVFDPSLSADGWKLKVKGLVEKEYELTYAELTALPSELVTVGMMCISNPVGGGLIGNTTWRGVKLADLLARAKPKKGVVDLLMQAADGYTDSIPYQKALDPDVVLVWEMGGAPLTSQHGFPARLLVPGIYGMKHVKWLTSIELVNHDYKGFWQQPSQGWSDPAPVNVMSRIDRPTAGSTLDLKKRVISGIAFAGDRSISKVEVSTDGGKTWRQAYVKPPASSTSWVVWGYEWTPPAQGKYTVQVRAYDGAGKLQIAKAAEPYPNGATGYHKVTYQAR